MLFFIPTWMKTWGLFQPALYLCCVHKGYPVFPVYMYVKSHLMLWCVSLYTIDIFLFSHCIDSDNVHLPSEVLSLLLFCCSFTCSIDRSPSNPLKGSLQCPAITKPAPGLWTCDLLLLSTTQWGGMTPTGGWEARDTLKSYSCYSYGPDRHVFTMH